MVEYIDLSKEKHQAVFRCRFDKKLSMKDLIDICYEIDQPDNALIRDLYSDHIHTIDDYKDQIKSTVFYVFLFIFSLTISIITYLVFGVEAFELLSWLE